MNEINWNNFKAKFNGKEALSFEKLAYHLFCNEYNINKGIFRFKNQTGIETEPIKTEYEYVGFQAKYYDTKISDKKVDIIDSVKKAKSKNPNLNRILFYLNKEFSESTIKIKKDPQYKIDIENEAAKINLSIEWRVPSHFEIQLALPENNNLSEYFFSLGKTTEESNNNSSEIIKSQQTTIESLTQLLSSTEQARVQLSEEIRVNADNSKEKQHTLERLTTEAEKIRNERQIFYRIFPAKYQKELDEEENTKDLEQLSKEADEQQALRKELEIKENQRNASIKYRLSLNQNALFKYTEALSSINRAIELWPDNFQFQFQLGVLHYELGSFQNAEQILIKMLDTENLNSFEPELQKEAWNTLGMTNLGLRSPDKAIICFGKALDLQSKLYGKMICCGAEGLFHNMGIAYLKMDDWNKATYFTSKSLEANKSIYGEESMPVANSFNSLGELLREQGQDAQAKIQFELALGIFNKLGISAHPGLSILYDNLSHIHYNLSELKDSLKYALLGLSMKTILYGEKNFYTAKSYLILARVYKAMKMDAEVLDNYTTAADIYKGESKEGFFVLTLEKRNGLIDVYKELVLYLMVKREWLSAISYLEIVKSCQTLDIGENSIPVARVITKIADCQFHLKKPKVAIALWQQAKTIFEMNNGSHEEIDALFDNVAYANEIFNRENQRIHNHRR